MIAGELQASLAFTEPQARYDLANIATTASADGDGWILNGHKGVVFNGGTSDLIIVPAQDRRRTKRRERNYAVCACRPIRPACR